MSDNTFGSAPNGEQIRQTISEAKDHLKAAGSAAGDAVRDRARTAGHRAKSRAREAGGWARTQWDGVQGRVEAQPRQATLWALGLGVVAGILIGSALRGRD